MKHVLIVFFATFIFSSCVEKKMEAPPKPKPKPAPQFTLTNIKGSEVSLSDYKGSPLIINFWATWCVPCLKEMPMIERLYRAKKNSGLKVLMINIKESESVVKDFIETNGYSFQVALDKSGEVSEKFQVFGLPSTYFIDGQSVIQDRHMGELTREILYSGYGSIKTSAASQPVGRYENARVKIKALLSLPKNTMNFNRIIGMISDLLRVQRQRFISISKTEKNGIAMKVEDLLNEASMFASQDEYEECYKVLDGGLEVIVGSLNNMPDGHKQKQGVVTH